MPKLSQYIAVSLLSLTVAACSSRSTPRGTSTLNGLTKMGGAEIGKSKNGVSAIRETALRDTALTIGAQAGLACRSVEINKILEKHHKELDKTYNFQTMLLHHNVLPPVLVDGHNTLNVADPVTLRISDRTYKIYRQARFVTTAPNWRDYLWMEFREPEYPHSTMLPRDNAERDIWNHAVKQGWDNGFRQADSIFQQNLARLNMEMQGMVLYRKLLAQNMVSPPYVAKTDLGVTGNGSRININDQVLRITALPALNPDSSAWKAAVSETHKRVLSTDSLLPRDDSNGKDGAGMNGKFVNGQPIVISQDYLNDQG